MYPFFTACGCVRECNHPLSPRQTCSQWGLRLPLPPPRNIELGSPLVLCSPPCDGDTPRWVALKPWSLGFLIWKTSLERP